MTLLEKLQAHRGGLVRLPTPLFWRGGRGWDSTPERLCLLLDAVPITADVARRADGLGEAFIAAAAEQARIASSAALLLIDGHPRWVRVAAADVELISETR